MWSRLLEARPAYVAYGELAGCGDVATATVMEAFASGTLDLAFDPGRITGIVSARPAVGPLALAQARAGDRVTNQKGETVRLTPLHRCIVALLDGTRDVREIADAVDQARQAGTVGHEELLLRHGDAAGAESLTGEALRYLRNHALLIA